MKKLLCFALVLAMAAAAFAPGVSALAERDDRASSGGEPAAVSLYIDVSSEYYGLDIDVKAYVTDAYGEPAQYFDVEFCLLNGSGEEVEIYETFSSINGWAYAGWTFFDGEDDYGTYTVQVTVDDSKGGVLVDSGSFDFVEKNKPQVLTVEVPPETDTYSYGQSLCMLVNVTDNAGNPAQYAEIRVEFLHPDGSYVEEYFGWNYAYADIEGQACVEWLFGGREVPAGNYILRLTVGEARLDVPVTYLGRMAPKDILAYEGVRDTYYYGEDVYLHFLLIGENDEPIANEEVYYRILNADGTPADAEIIWYKQTEIYDWTDFDGLTNVNLCFPDPETVPEGSYILRLTVGAFYKDFSFTVEKGELQLLLDVGNNHTDEDYLLGYGDEIYVQTWTGYPGGYTEDFVHGLLHWWIENSDGETVYDHMPSYWTGEDTYDWFWLTERDIPGIKGWKDGLYTVVAERTVNGVTMRDQDSFYFRGWNGAGEAAQMTVDLNWTTFRPYDDFVAAVSVTDADGNLVQGQDVFVYLRYPNGEPAYIRFGDEGTLDRGHIGYDGTATLWNTFNNLYFASGTYKLVFVCGDLTVEKTVVLTGFINQSAGPKEVPTMTVTPDKTLYSVNDAIKLTFSFTGASAATIAEYKKLNYLEVYAEDSDGYTYHLYADEDGNLTFEDFKYYGAEPGTYTVWVNTYPDHYGWMAATATFTIRYTGTKPVGKMGDLNGDGKVNNIDYMMLKRYCLNTFELDERQIAVSDIDGNGTVNSVDYIRLKRYCLGTYEIGQNR